MTQEEREALAREEARKAVNERDEARKALNLRDILATSAGREFVWDIISLCGVYRSPVTDALETFRQVGHADIGRAVIKKVLTADENSYILMRSEAIVRDEAHASEINDHVEREMNE